ncbi:protein adenylyltransferase SelO [Ilumatobacter coccineus]|uniref:Protein nucleotidyltransferase YdiU n=1 Tax=Ilumatobacter coccineus (strain NBRC 103263 / KCTC 29153 / YM16-304) TaxID=1313172 RepID=A0A6C7E8Z5_ILUCY|nr:YdiU family protein [Ilumatobacter coccineus]BAN02833.1 hypothetical protein YM304_25190 [Ilumatobacter coccineus YM16-304]
MFHFDNSFVRDLPGLYERWNADTAPDPSLVALNDAHAESLGLEPAFLRTPDGIAILCGNAVPDGAEPVAQAYAGHQFGGFSPRLGDGRALLLGEHIDPSGKRHDIHLKGSGRTPFARGGDGKATLGPMLREQLMCEAMHALGVPTTRALATVATGEQVARETLLPGAIFVRTASSHLRVGSFQYAATHEDPSLLQRLLDYAIARHHPHAADADNPALAFLHAVLDAQASLVATWMSLGFVHGVMNTDNVTISGETIDYGPCAFMDAYDPATVFSSIDHGGRYAYGNQPQITQWNLARLAEPLLPFIDPDQDAAIEAATDALRTFPDVYERRYSERMRAKLGLNADTADVPDVPELLDGLLALMAADHVDWTTCWRSLSSAARGDREPVRLQFVDLAGIDAWLDRWEPHVDTDAATAMDAVNPVYIPRNHLVEEALTAAVDGDLTAAEQLTEVLGEPYVLQPGMERYAQPAPADFGRYRTFCGT